MNLAYKKILGKFTKVLGFGKTPPHVGKNSQIISFFFFESVPNLSFSSFLIKTKSGKKKSNSLSIHTYQHHWQSVQGEEKVQNYQSKMPNNHNFDELSANQSNNG